MIKTSQRSDALCSREVLEIQHMIAVHRAQSREITRTHRIFVLLTTFGRGTQSTFISNLRTIEIPSNSVLRACLALHVLYVEGHAEHIGPTAYLNASASSDTRVDERGSRGACRAAPPEG